MTPPKRRGLKNRAPLDNPLDEREARQQNREDAVESIFTRSRTEEPDGAEQPAAGAAVPPAPAAKPASVLAKKAAPTKTKRSSKPAPVPAAVEPAMPPAKHTPEPSVQFGPRIRSEIAERLATFCADLEATKQDTVDMALAEWLARRGYEAFPDIVVPELPGPVVLDAPGTARAGVPMPPRRSASKRKQLNVRIRPEVNQALLRFISDRPSVVQDIADLALAEFLTIRGYSLQPANTQAS